MDTMHGDHSQTGPGALIDALGAYPPGDERETRMVARTQTFLAAADDPFSRRSFVPGHITGSAWIVDEERTHALLVHHRKLDRWLQPGGHAEAERDALAIAEREAREETGLQHLRPAQPGIYDVDVHVIPARGDDPEHAHFDIRFAFIADRGEPLVVSEESHAVAWRPIAELDRDGVDESVRRLARKSAGLP
jgi:8-oxo-dGTP pyrophosphatase MutT (NUDIX family)